MMHDICVITTIHGDFDNRIYHRQVKSLLDSGYDVAVVAPWDFSKRTRGDFHYVQTSFPQSRFARVAHGLRTFRAVKSTPAKIYIFHDNDFLPWAWLLKKTTGRHVVYDAHENIPEDIRYGKDWIPKFLRAPLSAMFRVVENFVVGSIREVIIANPGPIEGRFAKQGARVVPVRNFAKFDIPQSFSTDRAVLYTGDLTRDYGVYNLLAIAREMKRRGLAVPLRIVDRFREDDRMRQYVKEAIASEGLNMEILASVPAERMPDILRKGCIGLSPIPHSPNKSLALPTKIFEYYAFGLAVIASDIAATRFVLDGGRLGFLLDPEDHGAWVDAIERLLSDSRLFSEYQTRGRKAVQETFTWHNEEARLLDYVRQLLKNEPACSQQ